MKPKKRNTHLVSPLKKLALATPLIALLCTACLPAADCAHHFVYQGNIEAPDSLLNDSLMIRFENLGDIEFGVAERQLNQMSVIEGNGHYEVMGEFLAQCVSDENAFGEKDYLKYEIVYKNNVIAKGRFSIPELAKQYTDSDFRTVLTLPLIHTD